MPSASEYIVKLAARGRHHFSTDEAVAALGDSVPAVRASLRRLKAKGEIADPHHGFHVIVPPAYRRLVCLPAEQFVPKLMKHLGESYYAALLSAAELHGAAHQRPQAFQVMVKTNRRPLQCGEMRVQFVARKDLARTPIVDKNTPRGPLRVASAEATALELVGYADQCGGLDNVATVLAELVEVIDAQKLLAAARQPHRLGAAPRVPPRSHRARESGKHLGATREESCTRLRPPRTCTTEGRHPTPRETEAGRECEQLDQ